jgi:hypothetical protein
LGDELDDELGVELAAGAVVGVSEGAGLEHAPTIRTADSKRALTPRCYVAGLCG